MVRLPWSLHPETADAGGLMDRRGLQIVTFDHDRSTEKVRGVRCGV